MSSRAPPVVVPSSGNNIIINPLQRGNPILECIRNIGKEFGDIVADYQVGRTTGVLFLSLRYHRLHPEYILTRIEKLGQSYSLRILLIVCDISEHKDPIRELTKSCLINNVTVIAAFSSQEAGHYLSTFKQFEYKPPDMIRERADKGYTAILRTTLTSISKVNKTDVETLRTSFGSLANIAKASTDQLQNLPGFGQVKVKNIKNAFEKPIRNKATNSLSLSQFTKSQTLLTHDPGPSLSSKASEREPTSLIENERPTRPPRSPSPVWDIEHDEHDGVLPLAPYIGPQSDLQPIFEIELDLN